MHHPVPVRIHERLGDIARVLERFADAERALALEPERIDSPSTSGMV